MNVIEAVSLAILIVVCAVPEGLPLMISLGFKRHVAAAIEAVSSTAGQFMPPIMGAAAFIIAEYTGLSYWDVAIAAFLPSLIYFIIMFFVVDIMSKKDNISGLPKDQLPPLGPSFRKTIPIMVPIVILVVMLALRMSVQLSIVVSLIALILILLHILSPEEQNAPVLYAMMALALTAIGITVTRYAPGHLLSAGRK